MQTATPDRTRKFRQAIGDFIEARKEEKLKGKDDPDKAAKYEYATWLADAARRADQIQLATHVAKATHTDARGSSLRVQPAQLTQHPDVGSHMLQQECPDDVVGNAAALDVYKLLKVEVEDKPLLHWLQVEDADLLAALSTSTTEAQELAVAFSAVLGSQEPRKSHSLAKQLYWLAGDEPAEDTDFHLLQPMFASSLAQVVHEDLQRARFSDTNKAARKGWRDKKPCADSYIDYRGLVIRKLGGTKPQNVSQLNSERGGINYLLPSLPPTAWQPQKNRSLLYRDSVFGPAFFYFGAVREHVRALIEFLKSEPPANLDTRNRRKALEKAIGQELAVFGASIRGAQPPGWSRDPACELVHCEQLWLDPERTQLPVRRDPEHPEWADEDEAFNADYERGEWADEVATRFGNWLNHRLRKAGLRNLSLTERNHWARQAVLDVAWPIPLQRRATEETA